jgi:alpha-galactosidase
MPRAAVGVGLVRPGRFPGRPGCFLPVYRRFFLEEVCINPQSRKPYIFYNTWNHQERLKYFRGQPPYSEMNAERMLAEIDVAHRLGVDVFVIDTGWYREDRRLAGQPRALPEGCRRSSAAWMNTA